MIPALVFITKHPSDMILNKMKEKKTNQTNIKVRFKLIEVNLSRVLLLTNLNTKRFRDI